MRNLVHLGILIVAMEVFACGGTKAGGMSEVPANNGGDAEKELPPSPTPPVKGAFDTGMYPNMFVALGVSEAAVTQKVEAAYRQFFHGNPETESVMYAAASNAHGASAYIKDIGSGDVRSEGMSYGMMMAVQMDKKADFDALWNWARTYMYHSDANHPDYGYFAWQLKDDGTVMDDNPAPDGEEYFVMALLFAANRWGNGKGIYDYTRAAHDILTAMVHREDKTGDVIQTNGETGSQFTINATITSLMSPESHMVRFTPNRLNFATNSDHTDPSYHLPAFYELFALWGPEADRAYWQKAAQVSRDYLVTVTHFETGLSPDYAGFDGKPVAASWNANSAHFGHDAHRTAMNWSVDCAWWAADVSRQEILSNRLLAFFEKEGVYAHFACYKLDGSAPLVEYRSIGLTAMNATTAMCTSHRASWEFIEMLWNTPLPTGKWRYYDGMLYMFGLLNLSGNYRIYKPAA